MLHVSSKVNCSGTWHRVTLRGEKLFFDDHATVEEYKALRRQTLLMNFGDKVSGCGKLLLAWQNGDFDMLPPELKAYRHTRQWLSTKAGRLARHVCRCSGNPALLVERDKLIEHATQASTSERMMICFIKALQFDLAARGIKPGSCWVGETGVELINVGILGDNLSNPYDLETWGVMRGRPDTLVKSSFISQDEPTVYIVIHRAGNFVWHCKISHREEYVELEPSPDKEPKPEHFVPLVKIVKGNKTVAGNIGKSVEVAGEIASRLYLRELYTHRYLTLSGRQYKSVNDLPDIHTLLRAGLEPATNTQEQIPGWSFTLAGTRYALSSTEAARLVAPEIEKLRKRLQRLSHASLKRAKIIRSQQQDKDQ